MSNVVPLKYRLDKNIASYASHIAKIFFLVLISTFPVYSSLFLPPNDLP